MVSDEIRNNPLIRQVAATSDEVLPALDRISQIVVRLCREVVAEQAAHEEQA